jgi:amino acid adenylation domain-containing protein
MSEVGSLANQVACRGANLWFADGKLRYRIAKNDSAAELIEFIRTHKEELTEEVKTAGPIEPAFPMSESQKMIWLSQELNPGGPAYHVVFSVIVRTQCDVARWQRALKRLAVRHPVLRSAYFSGGGVPFQRVMPSTLAPIERINAVQKSDEDVRAIADEFRRRPLRLDKGEVFRAGLVDLGVDRFLVLLVVHHIACDGWSVWIMSDELKDLYGEDGSADLPRLEKAYRDYVDTEQAFLLSKEYRKQAAYWTDKLAENPPRSILPRSASRSDGSAQASEFHFSLSPDLVIRIRNLAREEKTTTYVTLVAAFQSILHRWLGAETVTIASPMMGRQEPGFESVVGCFINVVLITQKMSSDDTFRQVIERAQREVLEALEHQEYPFIHLINDLKISRDAMGRAFSDVGFVHVRAQGSSRLNSLDSVLGDENGGMWGSLPFEPFPVCQQEGQFDLHLEVREIQEGMFCNLRYSSDVLGAAEAQRFIVWFEQLLESVTANPDLRLADAEWVPHDDLLSYQAWNSTRRDFSSSSALPQLIDAQADRCQDDIAVTCESETLRYCELKRQSNRLAHFLRSIDVGRGAVIGVCLDRSVALPVALLGILKAGAAYLPLDPNQPQSRLKYMVEDSGVRFVLAHERSRHLFGDFAVVSLSEEADNIASFPDEFTGNMPAPTDLAYVMYTSGSTGPPKGVMITHRGLVNFLESMMREPGIERSDTLLAITPITFDISGLELYLPLLAGAHVVIVRDDMSIVGDRLGELIDHSGATIVQATPSTWRMVSLAGWQPKRRVKMLCGGDALPGDLFRQMVGPNSEVWNLYGPTETTIWSTLTKLNGEPTTPYAPIGRPIANTAVFVLDGQRKLVPIGVPGELYIGGDGLAAGYLGQPALTSSKFVQIEGLNFSGPLYKTGDRVRWLADGNLEFLGRLDFQIKIRGHRVELGEIEAALLFLRGVKEAVVATKDDSFGEKRLVAYVVAEDDQQIPADPLEALAAMLPRHMIPAALVRLDRLPLNANGKVDRSALPLPVSEPSGGLNENDEDFDLVERDVIDVWQHVLGLQQINAGKTFFELGGHSLLAMRAIAQLREKHGYHCDLASFLSAPTVKGTANLLRRSTVSRGQASLVRLRGGGSGETFVCVHPLAGHAHIYGEFAKCLSPGATVYGVNAPEGMDGELSTVHGLAKRYIRYVDEQGIDGALCLVGYSFGGVIAIEMGRQLLLEGRGPDLVALLDTKYPVAAETVRLKADRRLMWLAFMEEVFPGLLRIAGLRESIYSYNSDEEIMAWIEGCLNRVGEPVPTGMLESLANVWHRHSNAFLGYAPARYDGEVIEFEADSADALSKQYFENRWDVFIPKLEKHGLRGGHRDVLSPTNSRYIAGIIQESLGRPVRGEGAAYATSGAALCAEGALGEPRLSNLMQVKR